MKRPGWFSDPSAEQRLFEEFLRVRAEEKRKTERKSKRKAAKRARKRNR